MGDVAKILGVAPSRPGVYLMKDQKGSIFYIGKAKDLHKRMLQYINPTSDSRFFVQILHRILAEVEFILTASEKEALILESNLIKDRKPRFNVRIKDDRNHLSLRMDIRQDFARLDLVRKREKDGALYFEPYHAAGKARTMLRLVNKFFVLRNCSDSMFKNARRPCLRYQMGHCLAPCSLPVSREDYMKEVRKVRLLLEGKKDLLLSELQTQMKDAAEKQYYERAAVVRDQINAVETTLEKQVMEVPQSVEWDVLGFHREGELAEFAVMQIRNGRMMGRQTYSARGYALDDATLLSRFIQEYYPSVNPMPREILLSHVPEGEQSLIEHILEGKQARVEFVVPQRGRKRRLLEIARENAENTFKERQSAGRERSAILERLQRKLSLPSRPERMECCDISVMQGSGAVGSIVCFMEGLPEKSEYRHYSIKGQDHNDDFAMMHEVLSRRFRRGMEEGNLPDLLVVDGGKGQLNIALEVARELGVSGMGIIGLAKSRWKDSVGHGQEAREVEGRWQTPERVFLPRVKNPLILKPGTGDLLMLQRLRDEAHRFAIEFHRKTRRKQTLRSGLLDIPGVGSKRMKLLLKHFGSLKNVKAATLEDLQAVVGIPDTLAKAVYGHFRQA